MAKISRRAFLRGTVAVGAGATLLRFSDGSYRIVLGASGPAAYKLRIIHTNDHHARIEPANLTIKSGTPAITRNFGGVARRKTLFDQIRSTNTGNDGLLFLDAGDVFQGTLYFNQYNGYADLDFYRQLGYDALAVGNHEFDKGDQVLADFIQGATTGTYPNPPANAPALTGSNIPVLSANITVSGGPLAGKIQPSIIKTVGGKKIGIFGLTTPETPILSSPSANVSFGSDLVAVAQAQINELRGAPNNCDIVIGLNHIGYTVDLDLASKVRGLNVIVGGHSHTPLLPGGSAGIPLGVTAVDVYPKVVSDLDGKDVIVVTDWEWGKWIGDLTLGFNAAGELVSAESPGTVKPVWADGLGTPPRDLIANEGAEITPDSAFQTRITDVYKPPIAALQATKIGATAVKLNGDRADVRTRETNLGDLIADAMRERLMKATDNPAGVPIVAITNGGGIRASINPGDVTVGGVLEVLPFGNTLARTDLTGALLLAALENGLSQIEIGAGRFPQISGIRFSWNRVSAPGQRIRRVWILVGDTYQPLDLAKTYRVATNNFMLTGGDGYAVFTQGSNKLDSGLIMADEVQAYITARSEGGAKPLNVTTEARIQEVRVLVPMIQRATAVLAGLAVG
jgi:5'-nucleotidase